jgi:hypothetical protein
VPVSGGVGGGGRKGHRPTTTAKRDLSIVI